MAEKLKPRRLRGHRRGAATCCVASATRPGVVASSGEDGCICWFDLRCKDVVFTVDAAEESISSLCFRSGNEEILYASAGSKVLCFDVKTGSHPKPVDTYSYNTDEINQIAFTAKSSFIAAADDSGDVKIIDTSQKCMFKTLRAAHRSICSSVQFIPWKPWTAISGGLDSRLALWDFSKGRLLFAFDFGASKAQNGLGSEQFFNPPFVHSIAVPEADTLGCFHRVCAIARGDGVVDIANFDSELLGQKSKGSSSRSSHSKSEKAKGDAAEEPKVQNRCKRVELDYSTGGHTAAVSCVSFSSFGEKGKLLLSGGNDAFVKLWNWSDWYVCTDIGSSDASSNVGPLQDININRKVNWLCTTSTDSENLIVCDTSKVLKVYSVQ